VIKAVVGHTNIAAQYGGMRRNILVAAAVGIAAKQFQFAPQDHEGAVAIISINISVNSHLINEITIRSLRLEEIYRYLFIDEKAYLLCNLMHAYPTNNHATTSVIIILNPCSVRKAYNGFRLFLLNKSAKRVFKPML